MKNGIRFHLCMTLCIAMLGSFSAFAQSSNDVKIGKQIWMSKNLDVSTFRNGELIPQAKNKDEWKKAGENKQPAWCFYDFDEKNGKQYGKLYNWFAVSDTRGLAPKGYHVPNQDEWNALFEHLGGVKIAAHKIKSKEDWKESNYREEKPCTECKGWTDEKRDRENCGTCNDDRYIKMPKVVIRGGDNSSGFTGLPGGYYNYKDEFLGIGKELLCWTTSDGFAGSEAALSINVYYNKSEVVKYSLKKTNGHSVRCIKD